MTNLVEFILGGNTELNAYSLVAFMSFVIIVCDCFHCQEQFKCWGAY